MKQKKMNTVTICFAAMMAAMVFVVTLFRFPLLGSKVHFANAVCLLSGMLLGPVVGGAAAGLGSALYDAFVGGYDFVNVLITFVSKFAMAFVCAHVLRAFRSHRNTVFSAVMASVIGALTYVALYMLKSLIYACFVNVVAPDALGIHMVSKLIPSLINAAVAVVAAPIFYHVLLPVLHSAGLTAKIRGE